MRHARHHILHLTLYTPHSMLGDRLYVTQYTPRVSNAIALHFPPALNDFASVSFTALLTARFTLFTLYPLHRSPNHLQLQSFLSITSHPLANSLVPNPNERGTPLSFGVPPFSSAFHLLWTIFLHFLSFFSYLFLVIPPFSSIFLHFPPFSPFSTIFLPFLSFFSYLFPGIPPFSFFLSFHHFPPFSTRFQRSSFLFCRFFLTFFLAFLHFPPVFNDFPSFFSYLFPVRFSFIFLGLSTDLGGIEAYRHLFA